MTYEEQEKAAAEFWKSYFAKFSRQHSGNESQDGSAQLPLSLDGGVVGADVSQAEAQPAQSKQMFAK